MFILFLLSFLYCKYKFSDIFKKTIMKRDEKNKIFKNLISYSWPVLFTGMFFTLFYSIDSFLLGYFKTATEVGFYNVVVPIALLLALTPELFLTLLFPMITKEYAKKNFDLIKETTKQIGKWIFIINFPLFLLLIAFSGTLINILFGAEYLVAETALKFLLIGSLFSSIFILSNNLLLMVGKSKIILYDTIFVSILNIILNVLLIPKNTIFGLDNYLGINGAAIATIISVITFNLILMFQARNYTSIIPLRKKIIKVILVSIVPFLVLIYLKSFFEFNIFLIINLVVLFLMSYLLLLFFVGGLDKNDIMILKSIKDKLILIRTKKLTDH